MKKLTLLVLIFVMCSAFTVVNYYPIDGYTYTGIKRLKRLELIKSGDKAKIDKFFSTFQSQLMKVSKKGSIKRKTASRKISRISKKISTIKK